MKYSTLILLISLIVLTACGENKVVTHSECVANECVEVEGKGANLCSDDSQCRPPGDDVGFGGDNGNGDCYLGMSLPADLPIFSEDSPWNTRIPKDAKVKENSAESIQAMKNRLESEGMQPRLALNYNKWTAPIHVIDSDNCKKVLVELSDETTAKYFHDSVDPDRDGKVMLPIPEEVWADPTSDSHMILVDPKKRTSWEFSKFKKVSDNEYKTTRFAIWNLTGEGYVEPFYGNPYWQFGANAAGVPFIRGLIRIEEMEAGQINHALMGATPINKKGEICSPVAQHTDGRSEDERAILEGARIQLNPELTEEDFDSWGLTEETKIIARALQEYGMFVRDSGKTFTINAQNLGSDGGAWKKYEGKINLNKIPLEEFRILECNVAVK